MSALSVGTLSAEARALAGAAGDYINEHGWSQHLWPGGRSTDMTDAVWQVREIPGSYSELVNHLGAALGVAPLSWNDAEGRTQGEVVGVLYAVEEGWL